MSVAGRAASRAAPDILDAFSPVAGDLYRAGRQGYKLYKDLTKTKKNKRKSKGGSVATPGTYQGKFSKAKKGITKEGQYSNQGILATNETYGTVQDPDCVYLMHTAVDQQNLMRNMCIALFRKLLKKGGIDVTSIDAVIPAVAFNDATTFKFELSTTTDGVESVYVNVLCSTGETLYSLSNQFLSAFTLIAAGYTSSTSGGNAGNDIRPYKLYFRTITYDGSGTVYPLQAVLNLNEEKMHVYGYSNIKIQNRSLASDSSSDRESVSSNPLQGKVYKFNTIPIARDKANYVLGQMEMFDSIMLARAAELEYAMREPPPSTVFTNCKGSAKIKLEPGAIKTSKVEYEKSMMFLTYLQRIGGRFGTAPNNQVYESIFPCELFALEDLINVNSAQNISCAYESNQVIGVYFTTHKKNRGLVRFSSGQINNTPV